MFKVHVIRTVLFGASIKGPDFFKTLTGQITIVLNLKLKPVSAYLQQYLELTILN